MGNYGARFQYTFHKINYVIYIHFHLLEIMDDTTVFSEKDLHLLCDIDPLPI